MEKQPDNKTKFETNELVYLKTKDQIADQGYIARLESAGYDLSTPNMVKIESIQHGGAVLLYGIRSEDKLLVMVPDSLIYKIELPELPHFWPGSKFDKAAIIDTSGLKPSPYITWRDMMQGMTSFLSSASPELRAFAAGQLYAISEQMLQEMIESENKK